MLMSFAAFSTISFVLSEFSNVSRAIRREQLFSAVILSSIALKILSNRWAVLLIACDYKTQSLTLNERDVKHTRNVSVTAAQLPWWLRSITWNCSRLPYLLEKLHGHDHSPLHAHTCTYTYTHTHRPTHMHNTRTHTEAHHTHMCAQGSQKRIQPW